MDSITRLTLRCKDVKHEVFIRLLNERVERFIITPYHSCFISESTYFLPAFLLPVYNAYVICFATDNEFSFSVNKESIRSEKCFLTNDLVLMYLLFEYDNTNGK